MSWIAAAVIVGLAAAATGYLYRRLVLRVAAKERSWSARAERTFDVDLVAPDALELAERALAALPGVEAVSVDSDDGRAEATLRGGWKTHGTLVRVSVDGSRRPTRLRIASRPLVPQLFDWGASRRNVDRVADTIAAEGVVAGRPARPGG